MGHTIKTMTIKQNGVSMTLDARKLVDESTLLCLKAKIYSPEGSSTQQANINLP